MDKRWFMNEVSKIKSSLTDEELFSSRAFSEIIHNIVVGVSESFNNRIDVEVKWQKPKDAVAYVCENKKMFLNANNNLVQGLPRNTRYVYLIGIVLHEIGHLLFTPFSLINKKIKQIENEGILSHQFCDNVNEYMDKYPSTRKHVAKLFHNVENRIEDGFIEPLLIQHFPGYGIYLKKVRESQLKDCYSLEEMRKKQLSDSAIMLNLLLIYAKFKVILAENDSTDPVLQTFKASTDVIDDACSELNPEARIQLMCEITAQIFTYLVSKEEEKKKENNRSSSESNDSSSKANDNADNNNNDTSDSTPTSEGQNNSSDINTNDADEPSSNSDDTNSNETAGSNDSDHDESIASNHSEDNSSNNENDSTSATNNDLGDSLNDNNADLSDTYNESSANAEKHSNDDESSLSEEDIESALNDLLSNMNEENDLDGLDNFDNASSIKSAEKQGGNDMDSTDDKSFEHNISDEENGDIDVSPILDRLENSVAEEKAEEKNEELVRDSLNTLKNDMDFGEYHKGISGNIKRLDPASEKKHQAYYEEIKPIVNRLVKEYKRKIKDISLGSHENGLYHGNRVGQFYRRDLKRFSRNIAPENIPDMSVVLLLDCSGSTGGERIEAEKKTALLLYHFCTQIGINIAIYGHRAKMDGCCYLESLAEFNSRDGKDKYRIANATAGGCNRDGYALRFCAEHVSKQNTSKKMVMIISDGAPNDSGYGYNYVPKEKRNGKEEVGNAKPDIQDALLSYHRKGIKFVTAGLGEDAPQIKDIYTDGLSAKVAATFLNISNLEELPRIFVDILKKEIFK